MGKFATFISTLLTLFIGIRAGAQPAADLTGLNSSGYLFIFKNCLYTEQPLAITDPRLLTENSAIWKPMREERFATFGSPKQLWLKFRINNSDSIPRDFAVVIANHIIKEITLYSLDRDRISFVARTGTQFPFYQRPYPFPLFVFPQILQKGETKTYFLLLDPKGSNIQMSLLLVTKKELEKQELRIYLVLGIFTGIILLVSFFNLYLFFIMREKIHLYYFLYSISILWLVLSTESLDFQFLYPDYPLLYSISKICSLPLSASLFLFVMQEFLSQTPQNSRLYKPVYVVKWLLLFIVLAELLFVIFGNLQDVNRINFTVYLATTYVSVSLVILSCIEKIKQKFYLAIFYLVAVGCFIVGAFINFLNLAGIINYFPIPPTMLEIGIILEAIIISFGILYRYNFFKKEKNKLEKALVEQELNISQQLISIQEAERERIAEDLHDQLGSSLAALKLRLQKAGIQAEQLPGILHVVDKASEDTRNISHNLMPPDFDKTSLENILSNYYARLHSDSGIRFQFYSSGEKLEFDKRTELVIYRILMELTGNIIKHSGATDATVQMIYYDDQLEMMVEDNGKGIMPENSNGIGLKNIKSRVTYLNGSLNIDSSSHGTTVVIQIPYKIK